MKLLFLLLFVNICFAEDFDRSEVTFGIEYSFQDQEMVNEPGRTTGLTPHKEKKIAALAKNFQQISNTQVEDLGFLIFFFTVNTSVAMKPMLTPSVSNLKHLLLQ